MLIRDYQSSDAAPIKRLIDAAFSPDESPVINACVSQLLTEDSSSKVKSLVAEHNHQIIGYVSFSALHVDSNPSLTGYILAPLAVFPDHQKKGIGSTLVNAGISYLIESEVDFICVYGDPNYYSRFEFTEDVASVFTTPYPLAYPTGWLGRWLSNQLRPSTPMSFSCVGALNKPALW